MPDTPSKKEEDINPSDAPEIQNDGKFRPRIAEYATGSKFRVGDSVYISATNGRALQGPYYIATVAVGKKTYTLSAGDGTAIENGRSFAERDLDFSN